MLTKIVKFLLFISSYTPLYLLLIFSNMGFTKADDVFNNKSYISGWQANKYFILCMGILVLISIVTIFFFAKIKSNTTLKCEIEDCRNQSSEVLNYFITYFIPILSMDVRSFNSVCINVFIFLIIGMLYVKGDILHLNPIMLLCGYEIFGISNKIVITKKRLFEIKEYIAEHNYIEVRNICGNIYIEKAIKRNKVK